MDVIQEVKSNKIVGSGTLVIEIKIMKNLKLGHIEDVNIESGNT